jgi:hypothetical protein
VSKVVIVIIGTLTLGCRVLVLAEITIQIGVVMGSRVWIRGLGIPFDRLVIECNQKMGFSAAERGLKLGPPRIHGKIELALRTRTMGGVGAGGLRPPVTRFGFFS